MKQNFALFSFLIILFSSCTKEFASKQENLTNASSDNSLSAISTLKAIDTSKGWYGQYSGFYGPYPTYSDSIIIHNGVASLPKISQSFDYTNIAYEIPSNRIISGDSITFDAVVRNQKANSFYDYDVVLQIYGDKNMAQVHFVADASAINYNEFVVGSTISKGLPQLIYNFEEFSDVKLVIKKNTAGVFINSRLIYTLKFKNIDRIGKAEKINIAGKGFVICDKVKVSNSYTRKLIFSENFNVDGKSNTIYY